MRKLLYIFLLLFPVLAFGQVVKTAAVPYTKGAGYTPNIAGSSEIRIDTATSALYWWSRDALTWMRFRPGVDVITGSVPPAYTPRDNMSLFAVNADSELFYYDGSTWNQIGGSGAGGIYGGSGTVPDNTTATLTDELTFSGGDLTNFSVETGSAMGGALASSFTAFATSYRDTLGDTKLELNDTGAEFSFGDGSTDRLTIDGRDARYAGDYSATFSDRSLIDKGYADAAVTAAVSIPSPEIAIGDDTGLTSSANFTYETGQMTLGGTLPIASIEDGGASSSTSGGLLRLANFDGAAMSSGHRLGALDFMAATDGSGGTAVGATVEVVARSNWSGTSSPTYISFKTANVGSTTPHEKFRITSTALGTTYRAELRDRTTLDLFNTGNTVNGRIEVTDTALYIIPPEGGINVGEVGINGKLGLSAGSVTITADENDLYMGTASDAVLIEIAATGATRTLTGINPVNSTNTSRLICLYNSGTEDIILSNQDVLSLQANRFNIISDFTLEPDNAIWLFHLSATEGWIMPGGGGNANAGQSAAMTAGTITISTTAVTANSLIFLTHASVGGTQGILSVGTITAGTSFVINSSSATDTGTVNWWIIN